MCGYECADADCTLRIGIAVAEKLHMNYTEGDGAFKQCKSDIEPGWNWRWLPSLSRRE